MFDILLVPFILSMFLSINMGGSGTAPAFASAFGANLIRKDLIPGLFGIFVFWGAVLAGKKVVLTIGQEILAPEIMSLTLTSIILFSVSLSLLIANILMVPQSTSQSTVFALVGPAIYFDKLNLKVLFINIIPTWFVMPILAFILTYFSAVILYKWCSKYSIIKTNYNTITAHPILKFIAIFACCYVAFAIGANNVANASGPIASMISNELNIQVYSDKFLIIMIVSTLMIAPCFTIGSSIFGAGTTTTIGKDIIDFGPAGAVLVSMVTASLLLAASLFKGIPTSLVQMSSGAIIALGIVKVGHKSIFTKKAIYRLLVIWIVSPIIAFVLSFILTWVADSVGLLTF